MVLQLIIFTMSCGTTRNAWIFLQRRVLNQSTTVGKLNLQNVSVDKLFEVKLNGVTQKYSLSNLSDLFPDSAPVHLPELNELISEFTDCNQIDKFRGKYLIYFLKKILTALAEDSNKRTKRQHFKIRRRVTMRISDNIMSELSQYAETPPCLSEFLLKLSTKRSQQLLLNIQASNEASQSS